MMGFVIFVIVLIALIAFVVYFGNMWHQSMTSGTVRLQEIAEALSWDYYQNYTLPVDVQKTLRSDSRLLSREYCYLETVNNAFVGKINGVETYVFNCPIVRSKKMLLGSGRGNMTTPITILLLMTSQEIPRFFVSERTWGDKYSDPILMTDSTTILGDSREDLAVLLQPSSLTHYESTGNLAVEGKGDFVVFYYANDPVLPRGYLSARKEDYFNLISEAEFLIETLGLGKSFKEKLNFD